MSAIEVLALVAGVVILIYAAKFLIEGLIGISARLAVPPFILAMLIISIDLEEFAPAVIGSWKELAALSYGSILGTVVFLILLALGSAAALFPIRHPDFPLRYIALLGAALALVWLLSLDGLVSTADGVVCLCAYVLFLVYLIRDMRRTRAARKEIEEAEGEVGKIIREPFWRSPLLFVLGLIGLVGGALLVIHGTEAVLRWSGIEQTVLGLTLLAIAANSVELVEAIVPAKQGLPEVVIGNVAGSSFFQLLFTLGICALIHPLPVGTTALRYFLPAVAVSWGFLFLIVRFGRTPRWVGMVLVLLYVAFAAGAIGIGLAP